MFALVGWDIAITETGPTIIEGNRAPAMIALQVQEPLKRKIFPAITKT